MKPIIVKHRERQTLAWIVYSQPHSRTTAFETWREALDYALKYGYRWGD